MLEMNVIGPDEWVQIMPVLPPADAQAALITWKRRAEQAGIVITDEDIREDLMWGGRERGHAVRFMVRKCTLGDHALSLTERPASQAPSSGTQGAERGSELF
jgi:hypothetical protein